MPPSLPCSSFSLSALPAIETQKWLFYKQVLTEEQTNIFSLRTFSILLENAVK